MLQYCPKQECSGGSGIAMEWADPHPELHLPMPSLKATEIAEQQTVK